MCKSIFKFQMAFFFVFPFISNVDWYKCSLSRVHLILKSALQVPSAPASCMPVKEPQDCLGLLLLVAGSLIFMNICFRFRLFIVPFFLGLNLLQDNTILSPKGLS